MKMEQNKQSRPPSKKRTKVQLELAQFFTPRPIALFMANMFKVRDGVIDLLDPGAGVGILGLTLTEHLSSSAKRINSSYIEFDAATYKILCGNIKSDTETCQARALHGDFTDIGIQFEEEGTKFSHVILNPPYFKLRVDSATSKKLRNNNIFITNIYAAFVWLSARLLRDNGELVAIIPRSFCNGPYFLQFREYITGNLSIDGIHIFNSRDKAFSGDSVLQENIIIHLSRRDQTPLVTVTYSNDHTFEDITTRLVSFDRIIHPSDATKTIHIPGKDQETHLNEVLDGKLSDIGINVSTGPVVDFRLKENVFTEPGQTTIPLLYPAHMNGLTAHWPKDNFTKKGQYYKPAKPFHTPSLANTVSAPSDKNILPLDGHYVIVRRFSSKEEKRRIFATVVSPSQFKSTYITFENHLNYFHLDRHGMDQDLAYGLWAYLNSSILDEHFRKISGHTQVNVTDLRRLPYPNMATLKDLGRYVQEHESVSDDIVKETILGERQ